MSGAGEVHLIELPEVEDGVVRLELSRRLVHRSEQIPELRLARRIDRRQDHEAVLRCHGASLKDFVARRLEMRHGVHRMPELREFVIHPAPGPALIA